MRPRGFLLAAALLPLLSPLLSCSLAGDYATLLRGNAHHRSGRYEEAASAYLTVHRPSWKAFIDFDLANSWARLGEDRAAEALYVTAIREGDADLARDAWFNRAVLAFEHGRYEAAYRGFREALRLDRGDAETRRNLEIAWRAWQKEGQAAPSGLSLSSRGEVRGSLQDLRLLRRLETGAWHPGTSSTAVPEAKDY
jgi:tetratricopeptide (TPR) repeat protein